MKRKFSSKLLALLLTLAMLLSLIPATFAAEIPFTDVPTNAWYYDSVVYVYENELMNGVSATEFEPEEAVTRAMLVTVLHRLAGKPETEAELPFTDVPADAYYADAVRWALEQEITNGVSATKFEPEENLTREQLATFVYRYAKKAELDVSAKGDLTAFPDADKISDYALEAMQWAVGFGLINGDKSAAGTFLLPQGDATRAQIAAILMRFVENSKPVEPPVPPKEKTTIKVFETSDIHGYIAETSSGNPETYQYRMAYLAGVYNEARADENVDGVIVLDGGDIYQGTPLSNLTYGNAIRAALDKMGYDAVSLGNHEFDWDVTLYAADENATIPAYKMGEFEGDSDIPVLAFNLYDAGTTNRAQIVDDYTILEKGGHKVAVIGYIPNYRGDIMAAKIAPYDIDPDLDALKALVEKVNETEEPSAIIILAHASPKSIAEAMDPELVDLVLGGHSHGTSNGIASNGVAYGQGGCWAQGYASTTIVIDNATGEVTVEMPVYTSITEDTSVLYETSEALDPTVLAITKAAIDSQAEVMNEVLGYVDQNIYRRQKIEGSDSTVAGNWLAGLMLDATADLGTVAAFTNSGGIRCDLLMEEGASTRNITVGDIYQISPFANHLLTYDVTGPQLAQQIVNALKNSNFGDQMSGLVATYYRDADRNYHVVSITLDDGTVVDLTDETTTYRVVVNEYCATLSAGGIDSVFKNLTPVQDVNAAPIDNQAAIECLKAIAAANDGYIPLDNTGRRIQVEAPVEAP